jgi:hypothetical protein
MSVKLLVLVRIRLPLGRRRKSLAAQEWPDGGPFTIGVPASPILAPLADSSYERY